MKAESTDCATKTPEKPKASRGWPPARRKAQAARARKTKPWKASTGPRTAKGLDRASLNATKHGMDSAPALELRALLAEHTRMLTALSLSCHPRAGGDPRGIIH